MAVEIARQTASESDAVSAGGNHVLSANLRRRVGPFELDVAFSVPAGVTILFGPSGAGKTTLLDCIVGLALPDSGRISIGDRVLFDSTSRTNVPVRERRAGYVFQDLALFPHLSVRRNVQYGVSSLASAEKRRRSDAILQSFRIAGLSERKPSGISGGEQQRVALARTLITDPSVLLLDEPLSGLDPATKAKIVEDLRSWDHARNIPILYVTHDHDEVFALGERVLVLERGRIIAQGTPHAVMTAPRQEIVAQLAGFENILDATVVSQHEDRGTMTCQIAGGLLELETPLVRASVGGKLRLGIRAGDILLATVAPSGLSARNVIPGKVVSLAQHDVIVEARVDCGVELIAQLTLAARDDLRLQPSRRVWLIVKTHSCHLMAAD
jgi:molybdate transport system ATP-binding protein